MILFLGNCLKHKFNLIRDYPKRSSDYYLSLTYRFQDAIEQRKMSLDADAWARFDLTSVSNLEQVIWK